MSQLSDDGVFPYTAPSNSATVTIAANFPRGYLHRSFKVDQPAGVDHVTLTPTTGQQIATNVAGAWMRLKVLLAPTNVSFYMVQIFEEGRDAANATGCFTNHPPSAHGTPQGANAWRPLNYRRLPTH